MPRPMATYFRARVVAGSSVGSGGGVSYRIWEFGRYVCEVKLSEV